MQPKALAGAIAGAVAGAAVWAAITYFTGYEIGYVAWGIGAAVGGGAALLGGEGATSGLVCAVLALAAILLGKIAATHFMAQKNLSEAIDATATRQLYEEWSTDAADFAALKDESEYPAFMVEHRFGYGEATRAEEITRAELEEFKTYSVPVLKKIGVPPMPYVDWREVERNLTTDAFNEQYSVIDEVQDSLGAIDIIFALLGVVTAWQLGTSGLNVSES